MGKAKTAGAAASTTTAPAPVAGVVAETPAWEENFSGFIRELIKKIGEKGGKANVLDAIKRLHGDVAHKFAEDQGTSLSQAINNANKKLGFLDDEPGAKKTGGKPQPTLFEDTNPTPDQLKKARDLIQKHGAKLVNDLLAELKEFGSVEKLEDSVSLLTELGVK